jgi:hypothetical protein
MSVRFILTVKPMQSLLGRIESEYILRELVLAGPALCLRCGSVSADIPEKTYAHRGRFLVGEGYVSPQFDGQECRVSFSYRYQSFYFTSRVTVDSAGNYRLVVPVDLFRDDSDGPSDACSISFYLGSSAIRALSLSDLPPGSVTVPEDFAGSRREKIVSITFSAGFPCGSDALLFRLNEALEMIRHKELGDGLRGCFLFADHQHALVLVPGSSIVSGVADDFSLEIRFRARTIRASARLSGCLSVNRSASILCLAITDAQEEDRRFLYENLYTGFYSG